MQSSRVTASVAALALVLVACQGGTELSADTEAFCDAAVDAEMRIARGPDVEFATATEDDVATAMAAFAEEVNPLIDAVEQNAPEEIQDAVATVASGARQALETGDEAAMESEQFQQADAEVDQFVLDNCDIETHEVEGFDYGYNGVDATYEVGRVAFDFSNTGEDLHEMVVFKLNNEEDSVQSLLEMPEEEAMQRITFSGVAFAEPGQSSVLFADLEAGKYAVVCFIPVGVSSFGELPEDESEAPGPPHFTQGMVSEFTVEG